MKYGHSEQIVLFDKDNCDLVFHIWLKHWSVVKVYCVIYTLAFDSPVESLWSPRGDYRGHPIYERELRPPPYPADGTYPTCNGLFFTNFARYR